MSEIKNHSPNLLHSFLLFEYEDVKPSKSPDGIISMRGIIQSAGKPNANNRIYPRPILEREDKKYQELLTQYEKLDEQWMRIDVGSPNSDLVQQKAIDAEKKLDDYCLQKGYNEEWGF